METLGTNMDIGIAKAHRLKVHTHVWARRSPDGRPLVTNTRQIAEQLFDLARDMDSWCAEWCAVMCALMCAWKCARLCAVFWASVIVVCSDVCPS